MEVGLRVVRGPDWKWGNQDDGEGHLGTVVEIGRVGGGVSSPDKTAVVVWDSGSKTNYRCGYQGFYDLRIVDNASIGVKHTVQCSGCHLPVIHGMRWHCTECSNISLCSPCYMADVHNIEHIFERIYSPDKPGILVGKRKGSKKIQSRGIFPGSHIVRGPDWDWANQDGGEGKIGKVKEIRGWDAESARSVACVVWESGNSNVYRLGHKGRVDIKYIQDAPGPYFYQAHLPNLGQSMSSALISAQNRGAQSLKVGDKVRVLLETDVLKAMQEGHGGWNPRMAEFIGKIGNVHRITDKGDVRVQYERQANRWTFHPGALTKVDHLQSGDCVKVHSDGKVVKNLQTGHGEWNKDMTMALGQIGKVTKVYSDGDVRVHVCNRSWTFNPALLQKLNSTQDVNTLSEVNPRPTPEAHPLTDILECLSMTDDNSRDTSSLLFYEAAQGHLGRVKEILLRSPSMVNAKKAGKTALQVASHQGFVDVIKQLILEGADIDMQDDDGDTALHYAAYGNSANSASVLLVNGAKSDLVNKNSCTPLHVSVTKGHNAVVKVLLRSNCNVNAQDSYGDTALHDAIAKSNNELIELLVESSATDFSICNKGGFNALHHAALNGHLRAVECLVAKAPELLNSKKNDGFSALHLAALNNHVHITRCLLEKSDCQVDLCNNRKQTALFLSVDQSHLPIVELLVDRGVDVTIADEDGDTPLHVALMHLGTNDPSNQQSTIEFCTRHNISLPEPLRGNACAAMACFLAKHGANLFAQNLQGKTCFNLLSSDAAMIESVVKEHIRGERFSHSPGPSSVSQVQATSQPASLQPASSVSSHVAATSKCRMCEQTANAKFLPCGDVIACMECAPLFKKCFVCKMTVNSVVEINDVSKECVVCCDEQATVMFAPCGHRITCAACCVRMKKCIKCQVVITGKLGQDGCRVENAIFEDQAMQATLESLRMLETRVRDMEDAHTCAVCLENKRNVAFLCGHGTCSECAKALYTCPMCRQPIQRKITLFD